MELADRGGQQAGANEEEDRETARVLSNSITWDSFADARLCTQQEAQLMRKIDKRDPGVQAGYLQTVSKLMPCATFLLLESFLTLFASQEGPAYATAWLNLLNNVTRDDVVQYVLAMIEQILARECCVFLPTPMSAERYCPEPASSNVDAA